MECSLFTLTLRLTRILFRQGSVEDKDHPVFVSICLKIWKLKNTQALQLVWKERKSGLLQHFPLGSLKRRFILLTFASQTIPFAFMIIDFSRTPGVPVNHQNPIVLP